jgi:hypothetical protein
MKRWQRFALGVVTSTILWVLALNEAFFPLGKYEDTVKAVKHICSYTNVPVPSVGFGNLWIVLVVCCFLETDVFS